MDKDTVSTVGKEKYGMKYTDYEWRCLYCNTIMCTTNVKYCPCCYPLGPTTQMIAEYDEYMKRILQLRPLNV